MQVLVIISDKQRTMYISKRGKALKPYLAMAIRNEWTWRLHDGSGWADGSLDAWATIGSITEPCIAQIVY